MYCTHLRLLHPISTSHASQSNANLILGVVLLFLKLHVCGGIVLLLLLLLYSIQSTLNAHAHTITLEYWRRLILYTSWQSYRKPICNYLQSTAIDDHIDEFIHKLFGYVLCDVINMTILSENFLDFVENSFYLLCKLA